MFLSLCLSAVSEGNHIKMFMRGRPITMFIPSDVDNYDDVRTELPSERLKLEWVYPSLCTQDVPGEVAVIINNNDKLYLCSTFHSRNVLKCFIEKTTCNQQFK